MPLTISSIDTEMGERLLSLTGFCDSLPTFKFRRFNNCSSFLALRNSTDISLLLLRASYNNKLFIYNIIYKNDFYK